VISLTDGKQILLIQDGDKPIWTDNNTLIYEKTEACTSGTDCSIFSGKRLLGFYRYDFVSAKETKISAIDTSLVGPMLQMSPVCESFLCQD
jgi:hypothetical protein